MKWKRGLRLNAYMPLHNQFLFWKLNYAESQICIRSVSGLITSMQISEY